MEHFDVLDCTGRKTGQRISRDEAHRSGVWHGAFHCLVIQEHEGRRYAIFQKRSASKKIAPNRFDVSVGGHYSAGEDAKSAGPREIMEELGLDVKFSDLVPLGRRIFVYCFTPGVLEYEFQDVFMLHRNIKPGEIRLQAEEVDCLLEMELEDGIRLFSGEIESLECSLRLPGDNFRQYVASANEFVPCLDMYYLKLLLLARRYFEGEKLLFI